MFRNSTLQKILVRRSLALLVVLTACATSSCAIVEKFAKVVIDEGDRKLQEEIDAGKIEIRTFTASPSAIASGNEVRLRWQVEGAESVTITPDVGAVALAGETVVRPTGDTEYVLLARYKTGEKDDKARVSINAATAQANSRGAAATTSVPVISRRFDPTITLPTLPSNSTAPADVPQPAQPPVLKPAPPPTVTPAPAPVLTPADEIWKVTITFQGAQLLHSSKEEECEVYVDLSASGGTSKAGGVTWKHLTDADAPTFEKYNQRRMANAQYVLTVDGDDRISFNLVFFERDGEYHPCATFSESFKNVRACPAVDSLADNTWLASERYKGDYGDQDFLVAYKLETKRIK